MYFEALELVYGDVQRRFNQSDLHVIKELEQLLLNASNKQEIESLSSDLKDYLRSDVDIARLRIQLAMIPDMLRTAFASNITIKKVTNVRTIAEAMGQSEIYKGMLTELDKVLKIFFTFPVTSATAERSFSALRRVKTFLRTSMTERRLNNLFVMYVHQQRLDSLPLPDVGMEFVSANARRMNYFGKF